MPEVAITAITSQGDAGGAVISRYHWYNTSQAPITGANISAHAFQLRALYAAFSAHFPSNYNWTVDPEVTVIDEFSGKLLRYMDDPAPQAGVGGSGSLSHAAGVGLRIVWRTTVVGAHRLIRGANFITPISINDLDVDGSPGNAALTALRNGANNYISGLVAGGITPVVYHRPAKGTQVGGVAAPIQSAEVPDRISSLRSRRS
jgi:hypothetical protein